MNKKIKNSIDKIEPEAGAKKRMYRNIMKKAAKSEKKQMPAVKIARIALPIAACVCIAVLGFTRLPKGTDVIDIPDNSVVLGNNPISDAQDASDFESLGITIDAPEGAGDKTYAVIAGEIAEVRFSLDGHSYRLRASKSDDISGINGEIISHEPIENHGDAEIVTMDVLGTGECKLIEWTADGIYYSLSNSDGAQSDEIRAVFEKIK